MNIINIIKDLEKFTKPFVNKEKKIVEDVYFIFGNDEVNNYIRIFFDLRTKDLIQIYGWAGKEDNCEKVGNLRSAEPVKVFVEKWKDKIKIEVE